jgi:hypothetical protein
VRSWIELPDSAGVNFGEAGAVELATTLIARGIGVEAGIFSVDDAQRLIAAGLAQQCHHVQIEPILTQNVSKALATAQAIERVLDEAGVTTPPSQISPRAESNTAAIRSPRAKPCKY